VNLQEFVPRSLPALRVQVEPVADEDVLDCGSADLGDPQFLELADDPGEPPLVLAGQLEDQVLNLLGCLRTTVLLRLGILFLRRSRPPSPGGAI